MEHAPLVAWQARTTGNLVRDLTLSIAAIRSTESVLRALTQC